MNIIQKHFSNTYSHLLLPPTNGFQAQGSVTSEDIETKEKEKKVPLSSVPF